MNRTTLTAVLLATTLLLSGVTGPALANHTEESEDEGVLGGMLSSDSSITAAVGAAVDGVLGRLNHIRNDPDTTATEEENDVRTWFNSNNHSEDFESYVNKRTTASEEDNVLKLTYEIDGESATHYLVSDVVDGNYTNATITTDTDREVDESCTLSGSAAVNAKEELKSFHGEFVTADKDVTKEFLIQKRMEYVGSDVTCSFRED